MDGENCYTIPDPQVCEQARLSRDPRFDGLFFTAVTSTRIYCRPVCPVPTVRREHVRYYATAAAAEAAGFRPCLRCRPELAPGAWRRGDALIERALQLIDDGFLVSEPLAALAGRIGLGERQLRRLFVERLGAPPLSVHNTRRLLFAKQLLTETALPITDVALEAGFGSLRRFNASFRAAYRLTPGDLRRKPRRTEDETLTLRLGYRPPYDFSSLLDFLRERALPDVEAVDECSYARAFGPRDAPGWLRVSAWPCDQHALRLQLHCPQPLRILDVVTRVRRMFDLDADPETIRARLSRDAHLHPLLVRHPGLRLPGGWDGFEVAVCAVLERQSGVAAARTLAARLVRHCGLALETPSVPGLHRLFPAPEALADADLAAAGFTRLQADRVRVIAHALLDGKVDFQPGRTLDDFVARWLALPGIDVWTAHAIALRALGHPDAFPADDLFLHHVAGGGNSAALHTHAERWRPWRAYAVMHLWRDGVQMPRDFNRPLRDRGEEIHARRSS